MSISVSCSDCGKGYKVDDRFAGKTAKCKACGGALNIPAAGAASAARVAPAAASAPTGVRPMAGAARSSTAQPSTRAPARKAAEADPFSSDLDFSSLAALESTGTVDQSAYEPVTAAEVRRRKDELMPLAPAAAASSNRGTSYAEALAMRGGKGKLNAKAANPLEKEQFSLKSLQPRGFFGWLWASLLVAGLLGLVSQTLATYAAIGVGSVALLFLIHGLIMPGILARREDFTVYLLYRYMPLYQLYFIITRWEETSRCVLSLIQGALLMVIALMLVARAGPGSVARVFYHPDRSHLEDTLDEEDAPRGQHRSTAGSTRTDPDADAPMPDPSSPKGAVVKFMVAMGMGDADSLKAVTFNIDPDLITANAAFLLAHRELDELAAGKFANSPPPNPMRPKTPNQLAEDAAKLVQGESEQIDGDFATVGRAKDKPVKLKKTDGNWQVDASFLFGELPPERARLGTLGLQIGTRVTKEVIDEVSRGQYASWPAVQKAVKDKTQAAQEDDEEYKNAKKAGAIGGLKG